MNRLDFPPANYEVEDQLKRIAASPRFRNAPNPCAFLELSVRRALKGKKTTGNVVAKALFGEKFIQGISPDVRVTARNLRKTLDRYYENEGKTDVVIISYPEPLTDKTIKPLEGEAYTPRFAYNPNHETWILLRMAYRQLEQPTYRDYCNALGIFTNILDREPDNIGASLGLIETICRFADRHWDYPVTFAPYAVCMTLFNKLEDRAADHWRLWAAKAYFHKGQQKDELVASCYEKALSLNRTATESYLPYVEFLLASGRMEEGLGLAQRYVNERVEDSTAVAQYGRMLYCTGRHDIAIGHLQAALAMDPSNLLAHETLAAIRFTQRDIEGLLTHLRVLKTLCDAQSFACISRFLQECEGQYSLTGCIANLLPQLTSAPSDAIAKP
jgi:tetratricopeptide (TPR) repeat protein